MCEPPVFIPSFSSAASVVYKRQGYVFALFNLVAGATAMSMREIKDPKRAAQIMFVLIFTLAGSTLGLATSVGGLAWLLILPQQVVRSMSGALFSHSINVAVPDRVRATALSVRNASRVPVPYTHRTRPTKREVYTSVVAGRIKKNIGYDTCR